MFEKRGYPKIYEFLMDKEIIDEEKLDSKWRKENLILRIKCKKGDYVLKVISNRDKLDEMERIKLLKNEYPNILTNFHVYEDNAYLMDFIEGKSFFDLNVKDRIDKAELAGKVLASTWNGQIAKKIDISDKVKAGFDKYRWKKCKKFFTDDEIKDYDFSVFSVVPDKPSHNDLNAANLLYNEGVKIIDPSNEGYNDLARDVGRYCASIFFNNYDYFGNDKGYSLDIAYSFLSRFDNLLLDRARYYMGESFMAFLNFDTKTCSKEMLKRLSINLFTKENIIDGLEKSI